MIIRLYFLLPDELMTRTVIDDLVQHGIKHQRIHALRRNRNSPDHQNTNPQWQRLDMAQRIEKLAWNCNLAIFFLALAIMVLALINSQGWLAISSAIVMIACFTLGNFFASHIPRVHLKEFEDALSHGEVLLMVDVDEKQTAQIEELVSRHHPAAIAGGSSWTIHSLGI
ncbi:MAG: hypothetical protein EP315_05770 [Gammaproteobacteria bacterium]|nr:MAG: hypothetical protein EP315_05770 [Gammaproteobacteria bacterium]